MMADTHGEWPGTGDNPMLAPSQDEPEQADDYEEHDDERRTQGWLMPWRASRESRRGTNDAAPLWADEQT